MTDKELNRRADDAARRLRGESEVREGPDGRMLEVAELRYLISQRKRADLSADERREIELIEKSCHWKALDPPQLQENGCYATHEARGLTRKEASEFCDLKTGFLEACGGVFSFVKPHLA